MKYLIIWLPLLSACTNVGVAPLKDAVEGAVHRRIEAREEPVQVCTCQTQCSIAEIPKN